VEVQRERRIFYTSFSSLSPPPSSSPPFLTESSISGNERVFVELLPKERNSLLCPRI